MSADRIVAMGLRGWERHYNSRVESSGLTRGVAYGVYVDAVREQNERQYRRLAAPQRARLRSVSALMKGYSDVLGKMEWLFQGGNAVDPEGDTLELARAEARMLQSAIRKTRQPTSRVSGAETSVARELGKLDIRLASRVENTKTFYGGMGRSRSQVAAEILAKPKELRSVYARLKTLLANEPTGVRFEALTAIRELTATGTR